VRVTEYLADKSALARMGSAPVAEALVPLIDRGLVWICGVTELEMLFSARNTDERGRMREHLTNSFNRAIEPQDVWAQASGIQETLTSKGQHRGASIADLIVAATARACRLTVLHYDADFETIAAVTGQPTRWVVPAGTV
jgi:predicted nucleic acid-binding protein